MERRSGFDIEIPDLDNKKRFCIVVFEGFLKQKKLWDLSGSWAVRDLFHTPATKMLLKQYFHLTTISVRTKGSRQKKTRIFYGQADRKG